MSEALEVTSHDLVKLGPEKSKLAAALGRFWPEVFVVALVVILWAPRLSGPIDLRWDAGVYYILGTSLAEGHGYRILSEPGAPEAIQYPPLLAAVVAGYEKMLGTTDPDVVAPWLRKSYAALFVLYGISVLALARRYLRPTFALIATALCLLYVWTIFLSDLLYAEVPFALVSVLFVLVAGNAALSRRPWLREAVSFLLAAAGFLLRTAGVALLAAWVFEAGLRQRWTLAVARGALALLPLLSWQGYVVRVRASHHYKHPTYEYQRAPYLYYNVSYGDNVLLTDPSQPALGRVNAKAIASRLVANVPSAIIGLGETVSTERRFWIKALNSVQRMVGQTVIGKNLVLIPILLLAGVVMSGLVFLVRRGAVLVTLFVGISIALMLTTPWPLQFPRYLAPLASFLAIAAVLSLSQLYSAVPRLGRVGLASFLLLTLVPQTYAAWGLFYDRGHQPASFIPGRGALGPRFFFHDQAWAEWEEAVAWLGEHSTPEAIVATPESHLCYLRTQRQAVSPPIESDPVRARHLLESVPVSYVIVDELGFTDVSRRYARPAVESDPMEWRLVHSVTNGTQIYERTADQEQSAPTDLSESAR
jgi:hypothetical protein